MPLIAQANADKNQRKSVKSACCHINQRSIIKIINQRSNI